MQRIAILIVNYNSGTLLERCLQCLRDQHLAPVRIIVVDNHSSDGSERVCAAFAGVQLLRQPDNLGFAEACNIGVKAASDCDWIAMLNPDAFAAPDWVEAMSAALHRYPEYDSFACRLLDAADPAQLDGAGDVYHMSGLPWRRFHGERDTAAAGVCEEVFAPCAAAALYRRSALESAGGFDAALFCYLEDVDIGFRLQLMGMRCLYLPTAVVHHMGSAIAGRRSGFQVYHGHRNLVRVFVKNMPGVLFWLLLPVHVVLNVVSVVWFAARGQPGTILRAKRDALRDLPAAWRMRRRVQRLRVAPLARVWSLLDKSLLWRASP